MKHRRMCECGRPIYVRKQKERKRYTSDAEHNRCARCYRSLMDSVRCHPPPRPYSCEALSVAAE